MTLDTKEVRKLKLGVLGISGRMGKELEELLRFPRFSTRLEIVSSPGRGDSLDALFQAEAWLDFSSPAGALSLCREAIKRKTKIPLVVGSTGWTSSELEELERAAEVFPVLRAPNFSLGLQICRTTLRSWQHFPELANWKVSIRDLHHVGKKDSPSGTALLLKDALGREVEILSTREGDQIGRHEVVLESESEKIVLIHEVKRRAVFAEAALEVVLRLANADPGTLPARLLGLEDLYLRRDA